MASSPSTNSRFANSPRSQRPLTEEQREMIATFKDFTHSMESDTTCARLLDAHGWDIDAAVIAALSGDWPTEPLQNSNFNRTGDIRNRNVSSSLSPRYQSPRVTFPAASHIDNVNRPAHQRGIHQGRAPLLGRVVRTLFTPILSILGDGESENYMESARKFSDEFEMKYGQTHPKFLIDSYRQATTTANRESKFLAIYLHSEEHEDSVSFCTRTLCSDQLCRFFDLRQDRLMMWAGSVKFAEAYAVSDALGCAGYPFIALLTCLSQGVNVVEKLQGNISSEQLIGRLSNAMDVHQQAVDQAQSERLSREEAALLREEQDREYEASLEADRQREAALREKKEQEERERQEEERRLREEQERQKQLLEERVAAIATKRANLPEPPQRGSPNSAFIRFQLHNGSRLERCFNGNDRLEVVRSFIDVEFYDRDINIVNYELATNYPRRAWGPDDTSITLSDAGLCPQAVVYVQDLDS